MEEEDEEEEEEENGKEREKKRVKKKSKALRKVFIFSTAQACNLSPVIERTKSLHTWPIHRFQR